MGGHARTCREAGADAARRRVDRGSGGALGRAVRHRGSNAPKDSDPMEALAEDEDLWRMDALGVGGPGLRACGRGAAVRKTTLFKIIDLGNFLAYDFYR